jgi:hypothetical protein
MFGECNFDLRNKILSTWEINAERPKLTRWGNRDNLLSLMVSAEASRKVSTVQLEHLLISASTSQNLSLSASAVVTAED